MEKNEKTKEIERYDKGAEMILYFMLIVQVVVTVGLFIGAVTGHLPF